MKIGFVLSHISKSFQWLWYSEELQKRNISHFYIIIGDMDSLLVEDLRNKNIKVYFLEHKNTISLFFNFFKIIRIFQTEHPDIIHTSLPYGNLLGQSSAFLLNIGNRITTCENTSWAHDFKNKKQEFIDKLTFKFSKKIIVTCQTGEDYLKNNWNIAPTKIVTIPQAIKPEIYQSITDIKIDALRQTLMLSKDNFIIGMIARFEYWKGHIYVIEAVRKLQSKYPNIKLLIVGSKGPEYEKIMGKIKEYNLEDVILYKGFINDIPTLFKILNIHIHVPINKSVETFGLNIIEGMASKCPQILTKSGIAYTTANHMKNSIIVDYCSTLDIIKAIELLINDTALANKLASQAEKDAIALFKIEMKVDKCLALYKSLLN